MCPFKSEAQKEKFKKLVKEGKITEETYRKWDSETTHHPLPERAPKRQRKMVMRAPKAKRIRKI